MILAHRNSRVVIPTKLLFGCLIRITTIGLYFHHRFFSLCKKKRDWTNLAKALNGNVDEELLEQYTGTTSLPFTPSEKRIIAVKIVDDRGVEMLIVKKI